MKRFFGLAAAIPAALALSCSAAHAQSVRSKIDQYMKANVKVDHFMGAILVAKDNKILIAKGYGMANVKNHIPNTANTEFRIGSITKQFTAMAILELQAEGKLNVHDPICNYVPHCPKDWRPITITNVLDHTSGIPELLDSEAAIKKLQAHTLTGAQLLARFKNKPLDFKPGSRWKYSNSGYYLLGYIIRRVSGESYPQFLQQHIFSPLGMKDTEYDDNPPSAKNHAKGYHYFGGHYHSVEYMLNAYSAGAISSTVRDLYTWDRALETDKLLPKALQNQMFAPRARVEGNLLPLLGFHGRVHYGYGWFIAKEFGHLTYSHEGGTLAFTSLNRWFPKQHAYVIVLDNMSSPDIFSIGKNLAAIAFGKHYMIPAALKLKAIHLPARALQKFVGTYQLINDESMAITRHGDQLKTQITGQPAVPIFPESKTEFFLKIVNAQISFVTNDKGKVSSLIIHQHGMNIPGKRIKSKAAKKNTSPHKTVALTPKQLQRFVGNYQLAPGFSITITRHGDQLKEQATGQAALPIYPKSKTEFFLKAVNAQISFMTNSKGKITRLVLHQGGRTIPGKKIK